jgi:hypothetical protein
MTGRLDVFSIGLDITPGGSDFNHTSVEVLIDNVVSCSATIQLKEGFIFVVYSEQQCNSDVFTVILDASILYGQAWTSYFQLYMYTSDKPSLAKRQMLVWDLQETITDPNYPSPSAASSVSSA